MELDHNNWSLAETIFTSNLLQVPSVKFWSTYMTYIRRMNDTNNDPTGNNRTTVTSAYKFVLDNIGIDRESGQLWVDYIQFLKSTPGVIGGNQWQDQNKSDTLRQVYHRAISTPTTTVNQLWKEYDQFEQTVNKGTVSNLQATSVQNTNHT
jgi:cleavage stimulation factor subunit 3